MQAQRYMPPATQGQRHIPPAVRLPQLKRLKDTARNAADVHRKLDELGRPTTSAEFQLVVGTFAKLREWRACCQAVEELARARLPPDHAVAVCYSQAISACDKAKQWQRAVELLESMEVGAGIKPNEFHYSGAISACAKSGMSNVALQLFDAMRRAGVKPNEVVYNTLLSACPKGDAARAKQLLREMREANVRPGAKSYGAAIGACGPSAWRDALDLLSELESSPGIEPDTVCFNMAISTVGHAGEWAAALDLLERMKRRGLHRTTVTYSSIIGALSEGGQFARACTRTGTNKPLPCLRAELRPQPSRSTRRATDLRARLAPRSSRPCRRHAHGDAGRWCASRRRVLQLGHWRGRLRPRRRQGARPPQPDACAWGAAHGALVHVAHLCMRQGAPDGQGDRAPP